MPGAIFDWDGVIIDSHVQHEQSWERWAKEIGRELPPNFMKDTFGMKNDRIMGDYLKWVEPGDEEALNAAADHKEKLYRELVRESGIEPLPGVIALLDDLKEAGIPCSVGTSTPHENVRAVVDIAGLRGYFEGVSAAEDVKVGKPHPDVFLIAAKKIGRDPKDCIVFEDAHVGIEAAHRAGMKVIAVATTHPLESLHEADLAVASLEEVSAQTVLELLGA